MNAGGGRTRTPVENIFYPIDCPMPVGKYQLCVNQYSRRERIDAGFSVEIEFENNGEIYSFNYDKEVEGKILVAEYEYSRTNGFSMLTKTSPSLSTKTYWGLQTNKFHKVNAMMFSPNYWDKELGNQHLFFMLEGAVNEDPLVRGFYDEFLTESLSKHGSVFEALAAREWL